MNNPPPSRVQPIIAARDAVFRWPRQTRPTLDLTDLTLSAGEQVFLHGESGSGKTTLLSLLAGVLLPQQGDIKLLGQSYTALSGPARDRLRAHHIGYLFQQFNLLPWLSVLDNVILPCRISTQRARQAMDPLREAQRLLTRLDLEPTLWPRPAAELSVGQQQRVAAARALIGRPPLLIADEPTSALDAARQAHFLTLLRSECRASGAALLFVSHDLRLAEGFTRTVALHDINRAARTGTA